MGQFCCKDDKRSSDILQSYPNKEISILKPEDNEKKRRRIFSEIEDRRNNSTRTIGKSLILEEFDEYDESKIPSISLETCRKLKTMNRICPKVKETQELLRIVDHFEEKIQKMGINESEIKGPFLLKNGETYKGEISYWRKEGYGIQVYKNGSVYIGFFKEGKFEGEGAFLFNDSHDCYFGNFKNGKIEGLGKFYFDGGIKRYEGGFLNNRFHGVGSLYE